MGAALLTEPAARDRNDAGVAAKLGYIEPQSERPCDYAFPPPPGTPWQNYRSDARPVRIVDARLSATAPALHREGFMLADAASAPIDFLDEAAIRSVYYAQVAELARAALGGSAAYVFDHLVRRREAGSALTFGRRVAGERPSANGRVHNDYTEASGPRRMAQVLGDKAVGIGRYAIVNVWRPLRGPVLDAPLALCDARSVGSADLVASDVHYATRTGEIYLVMHSARHRWFYFPKMQLREALVFKQYDSWAGAVARFVPHAAFDDPHTPADAPLRESIEARCLVVFDR
jgi:nitrogen fixation protein